MFPRINGNARGAPEGQINPAQGRATPRAERHPGDAMHDPSPASCKSPPDLPSAGRGVDCRMRDFFHTVRTQGVALGYRPAALQAARKSPDVGAYRIRPTGTRSSDNRSPLSGRLKGVYDTLYSSSPFVNLHSLTTPKVWSKDHRTTSPRQHPHLSHSIFRAFRPS